MKFRAQRLDSIYSKNVRTSDIGSSDGSENAQSHETSANEERSGAQKGNIQIPAQYYRLSQDWRQVHNIIWGIPSIAISIITGVVVAAYTLPEGWPRIGVLGIGSIFFLP